MKGEIIMSKLELKWRSSKIKVMTDNPELVMNQYDSYKRTHRGDAGFSGFVKTLKKSFKVEIKVMAMIMEV